LQAAESVSGVDVGCIICDRQQLIVLIGCHSHCNHFDVPIVSILAEKCESSSHSILLPVCEENDHFLHTCSRGGIHYVYSLLHSTRDASASTCTCYACYLRDECGFVCEQRRSIWNPISSTLRAIIILASGWVDSCRSSPV